MKRAQPQQLLTITLVGDDWPTIRARVARIRYRVQEATGVALQWAWVVERNPRGTGHHVHAVHRGRWISHAALAAAAAREGAGHVWCSPARDGTGVERYLTKYLGKGDEQWAEYLALNGGRIVHTSRGWWLDEDGRPCTYREARRGDGTWIVHRRSR